MPAATPPSPSWRSPGRAPGRTAGQRPERGQASVELVAVAPVLALLAAAGLQAVLLGWATWAAADAARAAARADALGEPPERAARRALPGALGEGLRVRAGEEVVTVVVRVPRVLPVPVGTVTGTAGMVPQ